MTLFNRVPPGGSLDFVPRELHNAMVAAAEAHARTPRDKDRYSDYLGTLAIAKNSTGSDLRTGATAGISGVAFEPSESEPGPAYQRPHLTLNTPSEGDVWVVASEYIESGKSGKVWVPGTLSWTRVTGAGSKATSTGLTATLTDGDGLPVLWTADDDEGDPPDDEGERWGLILLGGLGGGTAATSCCGQTTPDGVDSLTFRTSDPGLLSEPVLTRPTTGDDYESSTFTLAGDVSTVAKSGTYKWVGVVDGEEFTTGRYQFTVTLTNVSGDADFEAEYRSMNEWADGGSQVFSLMSGSVAPDDAPYVIEVCGGEYP